MWRWRCRAHPARCGLTCVAKQSDASGTRLISAGRARPVTVLKIGAAAAWEPAATQSVHCVNNLGCLQVRVQFGTALSGDLCQNVMVVRNDTQDEQVRLSAAPGRPYVFARSPTWHYSKVRGTFPPVAMSPTFPGAFLTGIPAIDHEFRSAGNVVCVSCESLAVGPLVLHGGQPGEHDTRMLASGAVLLTAPRGLLASNVPRAST